ncbi:MAG: ATP-grasp domain-containing protein [Desulfobacterales bacterium]|nr:ATP-grasp domain-containing protein [Desulfobacterales bacterium]
MKLKSKPSILVSSVCGDIGCSAVRALRNVSNKIIGCDINSYSPVNHLLDKFFIAPPASDIGYFEFVIDTIKREEIDFFLPISEPEIRAINIIREKIELMGVKLLLNNSFIIETFLDKFKTVDFINSIGYRAPRTSLLKNYDGCFGFPVVVKPISGYGSKKLWIVRDEKDFEYIRLKDDGFLIVQEYIGTHLEEYTTGVFSDGKKVSSITFRRKLGFGGLSVEAILADDPFITELSLKVAQSSNLIGSINIQSRRLINENIFVPFEINPRISSTLMFRKKFGFDDTVWWMNILSGKKYSYKRKFSSGRAIRFTSECYFDMKK